MSKEQRFKWDEIQLGVCYYPEHWDEKLWGDDLRRMKENGIFTVRIAEFAWSKIEPREGEFTYDFFDAFLDTAKKHNIKVIFGTPTATPPAWLTNKYPDVLNCTIEGIPFYHGMRRHYNYNSKNYRDFSARIVEKIAKHYSGHPAIIGWQIDNELNCEVNVFYSESDTKAFREFLKGKYQTIKRLNEAWGTVFWNQTYQDFSEVYVPRNTIQKRTNPHQELDYIRFVSESAINFCKLQSDIINKYKKPGDFITTNGMFGHLDNHRLMDETLDVYTYDSYPNFAFGMDKPRESADLNDRMCSRSLSEVRSVCPHFGIMEQQSGANGWNTWIGSPAPKPGQMMLWAMQSIAHGADYISFFRWRTATMGTEIYWHGILDYDNNDNRKLAEVSRIWERTKAISEAAGASVASAFGMIKEYDNCWDGELDEWHKRIQGGSESEIFIASQLNHTPMDLVYILKETDVSQLNQYSVLFYPHPIIQKESTVALLTKYVANGGTLIIGCRAGQKDDTGKCQMTAMPGKLSEITGSVVKEYTFVHPDEPAVMMECAGQEVETGCFNDILAAAAPGAKVLAKYSGNYYKGAPALIETTYGKGKILHFGGTFTRNNMKMFFEFTDILSPYQDIIQMPEECELVVRVKGQNTYLFILNYVNWEAEMVLMKEMIDMDTEKPARGRILLQPYETKVYKI